MSARARTVADVLVVLALAAYAIPFFWQLLTSFKPEAELLRVPPLLPSRLTFSHYSVVFTKSLMPQALVNSQPNLLAEAGDLDPGHQLHDEVRTTLWDL